jgi:nicotinamidase/pyrazinamidase
MNQAMIPVEPEGSVLLLVDIQPDFMPGGALAVPDGDAILQPVDRLMRSGRFGLQVATQDWHPPDHVSFASQHPGRQPLETIEVHGHQQILWPDHCVQGTPGATLHPELDWRPVSVVVRKALDPTADTYSGFRNNVDAAGRRRSTGLNGLLRERGVERVYVCGLARDVCVRWTVEDALEAGFATALFWDLSRSVDPEGDAELRAALQDQGAAMLEFGDIAEQEG